jgi:hypothetical protein
VSLSNLFHKNQRGITMSFGNFLNVAVSTVSNKGYDVLQNNLPKIQELFKKQVGPALVTVAKDDAKMTLISQTVYDLLPAPIRLVVKKDVFVQFCLTHKDKILPVTQQDTP